MKPIRLLGALAVLALALAYSVRADVQSVMRTDQQWQCVAPDGAVVAKSARDDVVFAACANAVNKTQKTHKVVAATFEVRYLAPAVVEPEPVVTPVPPPATGSAKLSWDAPLTNTDGSPFTDLAGYLVQYGVSANALAASIRVSKDQVLTSMSVPQRVAYTVENLPAGTWYFAVRAYNAAGTESALSTVVSKTI